MSFITHQENNWSYVLIIVIWAAIVGGFIIYYAVDTANEIDFLHQNYLE